MKRFYELRNWTASECTDALSGSRVISSASGLAGAVVSGLRTPAGITITGSSILGFLGGFVVGDILSQMNANAICYEWVCP